MTGRQLLLILLFAAVTLGCGSGAYRLWRAQERAATVRAGVTPLPDLSRWPAELGRELNAAVAALDSGSDPLAALARYATLCHANGFSAQARRAWTTLRELDPANARWPRLLAELAESSGDLATTRQLLQETVRLDPGYAPAWIRLGDLWTEAGQFAPAEEAYTRARAAAPDDLRARFALLSFEAWHGRQGDPLREATTLVADHPGIRQLHELLAELHRVAGHAEAAARQRRLAADTKRLLDTRDPWLDALADACFDPNRFGLIGAKLLREHRLDEAGRILGRAVELFPADSRLWLAYSDVFDYGGQPSAVRATLARGVAACPDEPDLRVHYARALCVDQQADDAVRMLHEAIGRWPDHAGLATALGLSLRSAKRPAEAIAAFRRALELDPKQPDAHYNLAFCLLATHEPGTARASVEAALALRPDYPEALKLLGGLAVQTHDLATAEARLGRLLELQPDDADARLLNAVVQLQRGGDADSEGDSAGAAAHFARGLVLAPTFGPLLREASQLAARRGQLDEAIDLGRRFVQAEPADPNGYLDLGQLLLRSGQADQAREIWRRGLNAANQAGESKLAAEFQRLLAQ